MVRGRGRGGRVRWGAIGAGFLVAVGLLAVPGARAADGVSTGGGVVHLANLPKPEGLHSDAAYNSDLAFTGDYAIGGNYDGFGVYDISVPARPRLVSTVVCPGGQGDVSVSGDLLYFSVDYPRAGTECGAASVPTTDPEGFEGIRIFDISDKANPQYVAAVATDCGSHTNTLVPGKDGEHEYVYVSSYSPSERFPNCQPPHDKVSIIEVPLADPAAASVVNEPELFPDGGHRRTTGCHDITVYPERDIAAAACLGDGLLLDTSDPAEPRVVDRVQDPNFAFWHSATFTNDARNVVFTDELGGGSAATCTEEIGPERGADAVYSLDLGGASPELGFRSYYKLPRHQTETENCVAHNGSLIPVPGQDFFVQSWYQGGVSVIDLTDPDRPVEIGHFDRGPWKPDTLSTAGSWSAYYYRGHVYSSDIQRGLDVLKLTDPRLSEAENVRMDEFNPQSQPSFPSPR
ncbi:LVIVD repeat-containing protein [Streptomonospora nanhaiensis]|uniref:LVIVD repeat-containing protein n=1 Tax=Streptomonospora nanhaiensis TaxID=1323731 RepID=UPI003D35BF4B